MKIDSTTVTQDSDIAPDLADCCCSWRLRNGRNRVTDNCSSQEHDDNGQRSFLRSPTHGPSLQSNHPRVRKNRNVTPFPLQTLAHLTCQHAASRHANSQKKTAHSTSNPWQKCTRAVYVCALQ